jgi:hypothetical protein
MRIVGPAGSGFQVDGGLLSGNGLGDPAQPSIDSRML